MKLTPLADNVLLKTYNAEEDRKSGIILSTATKEKSVISEVGRRRPRHTMMSRSICQARRQGHHRQVRRYRS